LTGKEERFQPLSTRSPGIAEKADRTAFV